MSTGPDKKADARRRTELARLDVDLRDVVALAKRYKEADLSMAIEKMRAEWKRKWRKSSP